MATLIYENVPPPHPFDAIAFDIEYRYERIVNVVRERKRTLLTQLSEFCEEYDTLLSNRDKTEQELKSTKEHIERIKENDLKTMQEKLLLEIEKNIQDLRTSTANYSIQFECESIELETKLSKLGELIKVDCKLPIHSEIVSPIVTEIQKEKKGKHEVCALRGIAFDEETQLIYACDMRNSRVEILSKTGNFISDFDDVDLYRPWGVILFQKSIYVTDWIKCAIFHFHISTHQLIQKVGKQGSGKGEFSTPRSLAIGPDSALYVAEENNNRLSVFDTNLNFKKFIQHKMIQSPVDVKFTTNMLILDLESPSRIHVLTLQGKYLKSIISIETESWTYFFCLDSANNILVSLWNGNLVQVYNEKAKLLRNIGEDELHCPYGITTTQSGKLIVSNQKKNGLQIF